MERSPNAGSPITIHPSAQVFALGDPEPSQRSTRIVAGADCRIDSFVKIKPAGGSGDVLIAERC